MTTNRTDLKPGDKYRDVDGDIWTVDENGRVFYLFDNGRNIPFSSVDREIGPLTKLEGEEHHVPDYYLFPGGVQVIDISRHLTSNAGQAVQYIARSSRIDGVTKGDPLPDLYKARDMLADEIERLELAADRANEAA